MEYFANFENYKSILNEFGFCVIPNVLNDDECEEMNNGIWNALNYVSNGRIQKENEETWCEFYDMQPRHSMLLQHYGFGHSEYVWKLRKHQKILEIFSDFWNCDKNELLVSFDGISFNIPPEITKKGWRERAKKFERHIDQSVFKPDFQCVQSWITANDVNEHDATLYIMKNSHHYFKEFAENVINNNLLPKEPNKDWYALNDEQYEWFLNKGCEEVFVQCPKGSLVMWDSRCVHTGAQASNKRTTPNFRNIAYLCYEPRSKATAKHISDRIKWFEKGYMTSHSPSACRKFPKRPRIYAKQHMDFQNISPPSLNELQRRLVGYDV